MRKDSRLLPVENYNDSNFLTPSFLLTNIESRNSDLKGKKESSMLNQTHWNRYIDFIISRKYRTIPENTYTEKHHIIPKSLGGLDEESNIVILTGREHFIAHMILWKACGGKMSCAFNYMSNCSQGNFKLTAKQYAQVRKDAASHMSLLFQGREMSPQWRSNMSVASKKVWSNRTTKQSQQRSKKISNSTKEMWSNRTNDEKIQVSKKMSENGKGISRNKGLTRTEENCANIAEGTKKVWANRTQEEKDAIREKISKAMKGKKFSENRKVNMNKANIGKKCINNGVINTRVTLDELESYLNKGWKMGWTKRKGGK